MNAKKQKTINPPQRIKLNRKQKANKLSAEKHRHRAAAMLPLKKVLALSRLGKFLLR